jgi:type I restriction enzyme, S subunit
MTDLPPGWAWTTLGEIASWGSGGTPKTGESRFYGGSIPWAISGDLNDGVIAQTSSTITEDGLNLSSAKLVSPGTVLVAMYGATIGRLGIAGTPMATNQAIAFAQVHQAVVDPKFLFWYLRSQRDELLRAGKGAAQKNISQTLLRSWPIPVPPLAEQRRIVATLEKYLSRITAGESQVSNALSRARVLYGDLVDSLVAGTLTGEGSATNTNAAFINLAGRTGKKIDYRLLPGLPAGWSWRVASEVCSDIVCGGTPRAELMHRSAGDIPFLKVYNLTQDGRVDFTVRPMFIDSKTHEGLLRRSHVRPGDVLTNIVGPPLGKTVIVPESHPEWNINQAIVAFRAGPEISPEWLALVLRAPSVMRRLQATARATAGQFNIALSTCRELPIPVPCRQVQEDMVALGRQLLDAIEHVTNGAAGATARVSNLRKSVLALAFAGQLVEQDANDEPVSVLLERTAVRYGRGRARSAVSRAPQEETLL